MGELQSSQGIGSWITESELSERMLDGGSAPHMCLELKAVGSAWALVRKFKSATNPMGEPRTTAS